MFQFNVEPSWNSYITRGSPWAGWCWWRSGVCLVSRKRNLWLELSWHLSTKPTFGNWKEFAPATQFWDFWSLFIRYHPISKTYHQQLSLHCFISMNLLLLYTSPPTCPVQALANIRPHRRVKRILASGKWKWLKRFLFLQILNKTCGYVLLKKLSYGTLYKVLEATVVKLKFPKVITKHCHWSAVD